MVVNNNIKIFTLMGHKNLSVTKDKINLSVMMFLSVHHIFYFPQKSLYPVQNIYSILESCWLQWKPGTEQTDTFKSWLEVC